MQNIKRFVKKHRVLSKTANFLLRKKKAQFFTIKTAVDLTYKFLDIIPNEYDCIIGIPRGGLLFANIIACHYGRPLATPEGFIRGEVWFAKDVPLKPEEYKSILLVEDSIYTGKQLQEAKQKLLNYDPSLNIKTATIFATVDNLANKPRVDYCLITQRSWTYSEWNLLTSLINFKMANRLAVDMDGVLCFDCPPEIDIDEILYLNWLQNTSPKFIPSCKITAIITSRLEKYRPETEEWLRKHKIQYERLLMMPLKSKNQKTLERVSEFKANSLKQIDASWYWESNLNEAEAIFRLSGVPVFCFENMQLYGME